MTRILICEKLDPICAELFRAAGFEVEERTGLTPGQLPEAVGQYEGLVVRSAVKVTAELLARAGRLKVVGKAGSGLDTIDVAATEARGITVLSTPGRNANAVAELVLGFMLALARHLVPAHNALRAGRWEKSRFPGFELAGKTLGLIGFGAVGRRVGSLARGFGLDVLAYDPLLTAAEIETGGARAVSALTDLLAAGDFVSLHLPLSPETRGLISREVIFNRLKPGAFLINCARGGLVDEKALAEALAAGRLSGAGLDVFENEPLAPDHPFLSLDNVIITPHLGASTAEAQTNVARAIAEQMIEHFRAGSGGGRAA